MAKAQAVTLIISGEELAALEAIAQPKGWSIAMAVCFAIHAMIDAAKHQEANNG